MNISITKNKIGFFDVVIDGVNYGVFDQIEKDGLYSYYSRRQDRLTGDHYIAIGKSLNEFNKDNNNDSI